MIIRLKGATFSTNIGTLDSWSIKYTATNGSVTKKSGATSIKKDDTDGEILVFEFDTAKYTYKSGTIMSNGVSAGTISVSGNTITVNVNAGTTLGGKVEINFVMEAVGGEEPDTPTNYTFTINPTPTSATVTLSATGYSTVSGTGVTSITVAGGTEVNWSVSADGYTEQNGTWIANENKTMPVMLSASGGGTLNEYIGYDELAQYVKFGNVQTDAVDDTSDVIAVSKNGTTGDLDLVQTNADGKYTVFFLNLPLTVGSEVTLTATNYAGEMAPNVMIGIDSNISAFPVTNTWKNQAGSAYIATSHIYIQPSTTTNKNSSYLERGTGQFVGCSPTIGCWSVTASTSDYTQFSEFTLKVLDAGFAIYKNDSLVATVNNSKSNTYLDNTTLPAYFMISCAASTGYKISIKSVKVA